MVGNLTDATLAVNGSLRVIGQGCSRIAYISDDVVYKVQHDIDIPAKFNVSNVNEYTRITALESLPNNIRVPEVSLFNVSGTLVLAMQYITGDLVGDCWCFLDDEPCTDKCLSSDVISSLNSVGMSDLSYGNIVRVDDLYYIIDFGE